LHIARHFTHVTRHTSHVTRHFGRRSAQELLEGNEEYFKHQPWVPSKVTYLHHSSHATATILGSKLCARGAVKSIRSTRFGICQINFYFLLSFGSFNSQVALFTSKFELFPAVSTFERHTPIRSTIIIFIIIIDNVWGQECIPAHCRRQTQSFEALSSQC
jgi:hypothetical protein